MAELKVKNQQGGDAGSVNLDAKVFEADPNAVVVREVYNAFRANQRQGTHSTKTRGHVRGGGRKPWRQKGTGRARQGSIRAPQWRGGAIVFGPLPRKYREKVNKKKRQAAFRSLLSAKVAAGEIIVVESLDFSASPKTKSVLQFLDQIGARGKGRLLIITDSKNEALVKAAGNLAGSKTDPTKVEVVNAISIFDLLVASSVVVTKAAITALEERLK